MNQSEFSKTGPVRPKDVLRKKSCWSPDSLVRILPPYDDLRLPVTIVPAAIGVDLVRWVEGRTEVLNSLLYQFGAILFRDFRLTSAEQFEAFIRNISGELLEYRERSSPRSVVSGKIYTSTDYPPEYSIFLHNENSYQRTWPMKIFFFCKIPAEQGGETPLADTRRIFQSIAPEILEKFQKKKILYVRNYGQHLGLPWQTVFQTESRSEVEQYCRGAGIEYQWQEQNCLTTRQVRPAIATHPYTRESLWFNHAVFFHWSTLEAPVRHFLIDGFGVEELPYRTFYGDGSEIEESVLADIRAIYGRKTVIFPWQEGDILMLDNMLVAHARRPYTGSRKVLVGMSEPFGY